ncbi:protein of unknown function (DU1801) [Roseovarius pacificus]|jgi:hypothetical protein|uniref:YdhG-like domain-containing protein n=2 Tax=Rhodobacterales TaxID=204455 RepID=A0A1M7HBN1_9RHOB|nr:MULTISPECIES: DUF1801 domain-containing protein [Rhodobacterales]MDP5308824.1 DUF1801 domain-containing protein [Paracoccus sp. 2205BS29-5]GGO58297.1 hypothetical protein GCM10011315_27520 [Roseovarius pacificus]SHM25981.1 protein of unknown function (DU1801) [Roseovarius pacificus]
MMEESEKAKIVAQLKAVVAKVEPAAACVTKYGGTMIERVPGQPKSQFCGIFAYKDHVSLEFTNGAQLDDPERVLEGGGKHRRHIKLASLADIVDKRCEDFLRQTRDLEANLS